MRSYRASLLVRGVDPASPLPADRKGRDTRLR
jgi:hypothetical protein